MNSIVPDRPPCHYKFAYGINVRTKIDEPEPQTMRVCVEWAHKYGRRKIDERILDAGNLRIF